DSQGSVWIIARSAAVERRIIGVPGPPIIIAKTLSPRADVKRIIDDGRNIALVGGQVLRRRRGNDLWRRRRNDPRRRLEHRRAVPYKLFLRRVFCADRSRRG